MTISGWHRRFDLNPLEETTAFAVFSRDGEELERVPFLVSQLVGGSMELGPVLGFFDEPAPPGSRDAVTLPYLDAELEVVIDGNLVSVPLSRTDLAGLPACSGTDAD